MLKEIIQKLGTGFSAEPNKPVDIAALEKKIKYTFKDKTLILNALKHRSYLLISNEKSYFSNERLEFLGDAVLGMIVTEFLYRKFKTKNEGDLSKMKAVLVSRRVLGDIIETLALGEYLLLNYGEEKTGGRSRSSNLANLFESILGAIYLDGGIQPAIEFTETFLLKNSDELLIRNRYHNYKSALLERSQANGWGAPKYEVVEEIGPDHLKEFTVSVSVKDKYAAQGVGKSKKKAEQEAASNMLLKLGVILKNATDEAIS
jgi:ribonuclease-3